MPGAAVPLVRNDRPSCRDRTTSVAELRDAWARFVAVREWNQFHSPKNLVMALSCEAAELMEHFLWIDNAASQELVKDAVLREQVADEMADVAGVLFAAQCARSRSQRCRRPENGEKRVEISCGPDSWEVSPLRAVYGTTEVRDSIMLLRGMYAFAVLLLGAAIGFTQTPDTNNRPLAVAVPRQQVAPSRLCRRSMARRSSRLPSIPTSRRRCRRRKGVQLRRQQRRRVRCCPSRQLAPVPSRAATAGL